LNATLHSLDDAGARARWAALWAASPQRSPFSALAYGEALATALGVSAALHLVEAAGRDEAGALVLWRRRGPYRQVVLPPLTPYAAVLTRGPVEEAAVHARQSPFEALLGALEARYHVLRFPLHPAFTDVRAARWRGWAAQPFYTYRLVLDGPGAGTEGWSAPARRTYRKAAGAYRYAEHPAAAAAVAALCAAGYARHGRRPPLPEDRLTRLIDALRTAGLVRLCTVTPEGSDRIEGGLAVLHDGQEAAYWVAGSTPGPAMTVLLAEALPRLRADGLAAFDFVGANTPSIAEFKRRLGPALVPYFRIERCTRAGLALLLRLAGP
jgi:hypothetical protein